MELYGLTVSIIMIFVLGIIIAVSVAQGFICAKVKNPFAGLIIPLISLVIGMIPPFIIVNLEMIIQAIVICQIPTVIYLVIFAIVRIVLHGKKTSEPSQKEIEKMNIQDLKALTDKASPHGEVFSYYFMRNIYKPTFSVI